MTVLGLDRRYQFLEPLGRGGDGEVHLARDHYRDGCLVALKLLWPGSVRTPSEYRQLLGLHHPYLTEVYDAGHTEGAEERSYFTAEYFPGIGLAELPAPFDLELFSAALVATCGVIEALNAQGFRHGDIKPSHIRLQLDPFPDLRVIDLGQLTALGVEVPPRGTLPYAAPEIWGGVEAAPDRSTDLYALGMSALECLCGGLPVTGDHEQWRHWHLHGDRREALARAIVPCPPELREFVLACLEPHPRHRPRDAAALRQRLRASSRFRGAPRSAPPLRLARELDELREWQRGAGGGG